MQIYDWTQFKEETEFNIPIDDLFERWATSKGITSWFIETAEFRTSEGRVRDANEIAQKGDDFRWIFHIGSEVNGTVLESIENKIFKFTFGEKEPRSNEYVTVEVTFTSKEGGSRFKLHQADMSDSKFGRVNYHISCKMGWVFHISNLKSQIEGSHDLRLINENRMHVDAPSGYSLDDFSWSDLNVKEVIKASITEVYNKWATKKAITSWFLSKADFFDENGRKRDDHELIKAGDTYRWEFRSPTPLEGKILEINQNENIKFTFWGLNEEETSEVNVVFNEYKSGQTQVTIIQNNIIISEYAKYFLTLNCMVGWSYYLTNLRSIFESGFDLRS